MTESRSIQRVAVALFEGFTVLDVYGPVQAFASSRIVGADGKRQPLFQIFSMAAEAGRVKAGEGPASWAEWSFEKAPDYDILLIPGGFGTRAAVADQAFVERVAAASRRARITTTVCTGSAILARTGLLALVHQSIGRSSRESGFTMSPSVSRDTAPSSGASSGPPSTTGEVALCPAIWTRHSDTSRRITVPSASVNSATRSPWSPSARHTFSGRTV